MPWSNRRIPRAEPDAARRDGWLMLLLWLLVIAERLLYIKLIPSADDTVFVADAPYYYTSGLAFSQTGRIVYSGCPTALIMPGMPILIGIVARFFADGPALILALQVLWVLMGSLVPLFLYRSLRLFTRRSCAFLCSLIYLLPWHMEIDRYLLTECPYYLFFAMALYFMLRLGQDGARGKSEWFFALSVLGALLFRANILLFIVFAFLYWLLLRKFTLRDLLRRALILSLVLGLFLVPWTIRNARLFHAFIPVTYGAGNPVFEGSYQGENPPTDKEIDDLYGGYDVYAELAAERPDLLDETGKVYDPAMQQYVGQLVNTRLGQVRLHGWWKLRPLGLLKSYLYIKPRVMLNWVWYYIEVLGIRMQTAHRLRQLGFCACLAAVLLARRRFRLEIRFLFGTYLVSLLILALGFACDRYAQMLMPYRYLVIGLGLELLAQRLDGSLKRDRPPIKTVP